MLLCRHTNKVKRLYSKIVVWAIDKIKECDLKDWDIIGLLSRSLLRGAVALMPRLPECERCLYSAHDYRLVCAVHPTGVESDTCPDFVTDPRVESDTRSDFVTDPELEGKLFDDFLGLPEQMYPFVAYSWWASIR